MANEANPQEKQLDETKRAEGERERERERKTVGCCCASAACLKPMAVKNEGAQRSDDTPLVVVVL